VNTKSDRHRRISSRAITVKMNPSAPFEASNGAPSSSSALPFDLTLHSSIYSHITNVHDHLELLLGQVSHVHPLSNEQPPPQDVVTSDVLTLQASLQGHQSNLTQFINHLNRESMLPGAERFISRLKEHGSFIQRLESRKRAIRQVRQEISNVYVKVDGVRRDLRFTGERIEPLIKELGLISL
jgi:hypothetical protein